MKNYKILSIDGGGMRGVMPAVWLTKLQLYLEVPLYEYFDAIVGSSTGAILSCAVSSGIEPNSYVDFYYQYGPKVFPSFFPKMWSRLKRTFTQGISAPLYDGEGLEQALSDVFGSIKMSDLKINPTIVTAYNVSSDRATIIKNNNEYYSNFTIKDACKASAAAPIYFPAHVIKDSAYVDGGLVLNNPELCAIAELIREKNIDSNQIRLLSLGTGKVINKIKKKKATAMGAGEWALPLVGAIFDGSTDASTYIASNVIGKNNYFRLDTILDEKHSKLDNAKKKNIEYLHKIANDEKFDKLLFDFVKKV